MCARKGKTKWRSLLSGNDLKFYQIYATGRFVSLSKKPYFHTARHFLKISCYEAIFLHCTHSLNNLNTFLKHFFQEYINWVAFGCLLPQSNTHFNGVDQRINPQNIFVLSLPLCMHSKDDGT